MKLQKRSTLNLGCLTWKILVKICPLRMKRNSDPIRLPSLLDGAESHTRDKHWLLEPAKPKHIKRRLIYRKIRVKISPLRRYETEIQYHGLVDLRQIRCHSSFFILPILDSVIAARCAEVWILSNWFFVSELQHGNHILGLKT